MWRCAWGNRCCGLQVDAQLLVVQKLEEKEGVLQSTLAAMEKELAVRTQALELNKRKVRGDVASITLLVELCFC